MKRKLFLAFILLIGVGTRGHSLIDSTLNLLCEQALIEVVSSYEVEFDFASAIVMETETGSFLADIGIKRDNGRVETYSDGSNTPLRAGISRAVLFHCLMDKLSPEFVVDVDGGIYHDTIADCTIRDHNYRIGGYGCLRLTDILDRSDVGMIKAAEIAFNRDMGAYGAALRETGIYFADEPVNNSGSDQLWSPKDILGYTTYMSLKAQTCWINGIANGGRLVARENHEDYGLISTIKNQRATDSLRAAMLENVETGLEKRMKVAGTSVAGLSHVPSGGADGSYDLQAYAFFPYDSGHLAKYTVGVVVKKHGMPAGRLLPTQIVGQIITRMISHGYIKRLSDETAPFHRAEK